ncbi:MAG: 4'-phosphopantetheinyl transferase family protein [Syntrophales bacterium]
MLEQAYLAPSFQTALSPFEQSLAGDFGARRKNGFIAARICLKILAYKMGLVSPDQEADALETVNRKDRRPLLPGAEGRYYASVSHDRRFTLAVADKCPIGVDIETVSSKLVKGGHIFMNSEELAIAGSGRRNMAQAATMVWTAKEAVAKVLNLHLFDAWRLVRLVQLGLSESVFVYGNGELTVSHLFERERIVSIISAATVSGTTLQKLRRRARNKREEEPFSQAEAYPCPGGRKS